MTAEQRRWVVSVGVLFEGGLAAAGWFLGWLLGQSPLDVLRWDFGDALLGVAASIPMLLMFFILLALPVAGLVSIRQFFDEMVRPIFASCTVLDLGLISLAAGLGEELLFRGVLQRVISQWWGTAAGLGCASLLFGLLHPITLGYVVIAAVFGAYLGCLMIVFDNLLVVVLAHAVYDFVALIWLLRRGESCARG